ncbi:MAG: dipeptide epimerase [Cyclobacteriaceae bacterium]
MSTQPISITHVEIIPLDIPLKTPFTIAIGKKDSIQNVLIKIRLTNGVEGLGEAAPLEPINWENQATVLATLHSCKDFLLGKDVAEYRKIAHQIKGVFSIQATARCVIEMALLDAYTQTLGLPLYRFFGGAQNAIETDYTIDILPADQAKNLAASLTQRGYKTIKTKVGKHMDEDIDRILAIKEGAPGCNLMIDANQGFSVKQALTFLDKLADQHITPVLFEQPVIKHDLDGMRFIRENTSIPVAADETVFTAANAMAVVKSGCADIINIKLMKSGLIEALDIAAIARRANIGLMIGCMLETTLGLGCAAHFAAGLGGFQFVDLDPHLDPADNPFTGGPDFREALYDLSGIEKGIGVSLKPIKNE